MRLLLRVKDHLRAKKIVLQKVEATSYFLQPENAARIVWISTFGLMRRSIRKFNIPPPGQPPGI